MIYSLQGVLESLSPDQVSLNIGPMSLQVFSPTSTISVLGSPGDRVRLHTYLHVKDDVLALYGFATTDERDLFVILIGVSGVGPKLALALLSAMSPRSVAIAIASGDTQQLTRVSGLGKKMAGRLVLELKGKLEREWGEVVGAPGPDYDEVVAALSALGYAPSEARTAISRVRLEPEAPLEEKVRAVLQSLGTR